MIRIERIGGIVMSNPEYQLVESSIGQVERCSNRFTENFTREMHEMSASPARAAARACIDPLKFMQQARDHYRAIEACEISDAPSLVPDAEQFNLAANAMLSAMAKTLGADFNPGTREAWISALRLIAERALVPAHEAA
jgi:hypothetical protein